MIFDLHNEADALGADAFGGSPKPRTMRNIGSRFMQGGADFARFGALAVSALLPSEEDAPSGIGELDEQGLPQPGGGGQLYQEDVFRFIDDVIEPARKYWEPSGPSVSKAAETVEALARLPLQLTAGPAGLIGSTMMNTSADLVDAGVDPWTAVGAGVLEGGGTALAVALPVAGKTLGQTLKLIALNPVIGGVQTQATRSLLQAKGYEEQAESFNPLDPAARSLDLVLGGAFGGLSHYARVKAKLPVEVGDAIDTVESYKKVRNASPFDEAADPKAAQVHLDAQAKAAESIHAGEPVDVSQVIRRQPEGSADGLQVAQREALAAREELRAIMEAGEPRAEVDLDALLSRSYGDRPAYRVELAPEEQAVRQIVRREMAEMEAAGDLERTPRPGDRSGAEEAAARGETSRPDLIDELYGEGAPVKNREAFLALGAHVDDLDFVGRLAEESGAAVLDLGKIAEDGKAGGAQEGAEGSVERGVFQRAAGHGDNLVVPLVNPSAVQLRAVQKELQAAGYKVNLRLPGDLPSRAGEVASKTGDDAAAGLRRQAAEPVEVRRDDLPAKEIEGRPDADPLARDVEKMLEERGDLEIVTHHDADGQPVAVRASEIIGGAKADLERFRSIGKAYDRAALCLGLG